MTASSTTQLYLDIDENRHQALIDALVTEVKKDAAQPAATNDMALRAYFSAALEKGVSLEQMNLPKLAALSEDELRIAAEKLPDKLSPASRERFYKAAARREPAMRWDHLFPDGGNEIMLPLAAGAQSVDDRIAAYIEAHNTRAAAAFARAQQEDPQKAGRTIDQQEIRRDPADSSKLQVVNPNKPTNADGSKRWVPGQRLGAFLGEQNEWALQDDFQLENSRKASLTDAASSLPADMRELMQRTSSPTADKYDANSLMIVISRDPQKIGEMSSAQHWRSCMSEDGINFRYVEKDIAAGTLAAYVVSRDDPQARYPLMRQLLKPYQNPQTGESVLIPAKIYGADVGGNARTRQALHDSLSAFVRENVNAGKAGEFRMDKNLYGDGQAGYVTLRAEWTPASAQQALMRYYDSAMQEHLSEIQQRVDKLATISKRSTEFSDVEDTSRLEGEIKRIQSKIDTLQDPELFARGFYREARKTSPDSLPDPQLVRQEALSPEIRTRHTAIHELVQRGNAEPMRQYLNTLPLHERIDLTGDILSWPRTNMPEVVGLWHEALMQLPTAQARIAQAQIRIPNTVLVEGNTKKVTSHVVWFSQSQLAELPSADSRLTNIENMRIFDSSADEIKPQPAQVSVRLMETLTRDMAQTTDAGKRSQLLEFIQRFSKAQAIEAPQVVDMANRLMAQYHTDIDMLASPHSRTKLADRIIQAAQHDASIPAEAVAFAKQVVVDAIPLSVIQRHEFFIPEGDDAYSAAVDAAYKTRAYMKSIHVHNDPRSSEGMAQILQEIRALPNAEWRMTAMEDLIGEDRTDGYKAEISAMYLEAAESIQRPVSSVEAYSMAYKWNPDEQIAQKIIDIAYKNKGIMSFVQLAELTQPLLMPQINEQGQPVMDIQRPVYHQMAELMLEVMPKDTSANNDIGVGSSLLLLAKPGSDVEKRGAILLREGLESLPLARRREWASQLMEMANQISILVPNPPEGYGVLLSQHLNDVIEGKPYIAPAAAQSHTPQDERPLTASERAATPGLVQEVKTYLRDLNATYLQLKTQLDSSGHSNTMQGLATLIMQDRGIQFGTDTYNRFLSKMNGMVDGAKKIPVLAALMHQGDSMEVLDTPETYRALLADNPQLNEAYQKLSGQIDEGWTLTLRRVDSAKQGLQAVPAGAGLGLGAYGLYSSMQTFGHDMASDDTGRQAAAVARVSADVAAIGIDAAGGIASVRGAAPLLQKVAGRAAIPLAVASGAFETATAWQAGNRERAAEAVGSTAGGIIGGLAVGAAAGATAGVVGGSITGPGAIATGIAGGVIGGVGGAIVGGEAAKEYAQGATGWMLGIDDDIANIIRASSPTMRQELGLNYNHKNFNSAHEVSAADIEKVYAYLKSSGITAVNEINRFGDTIDSADLSNVMAENRRLSSAITGLDATWNKYLDDSGNGQIDLAEVRSALKLHHVDILALDKDADRTISAEELSNGLNAALSRPKNNDSQIS